MWEHDGGYTTAITHDRADGSIDHPAYGETSNSHDQKRVKALKRLFEWKHHGRDGDQWESPRSFSATATRTQNALTLEEPRCGRPHWSAGRFLQSIAYARAHLSERIAEEHARLACDSMARLQGDSRRLSC